MISAVDVILQAKEFNGHLQTVLTQIKYADLLQIAIEVERRFDKICEIRMGTDGTASLYILEYWNTGEHPAGHTDRLILGVENVICDLAGLL